MKIKTSQLYRLIIYFFITWDMGEAREPEQWKIKSGGNRQIFRCAGKS